LVSKLRIQARAYKSEEENHDVVLQIVGVIDFRKKIQDILSSSQLHRPITTVRPQTDLISLFGCERI
jgi:hypothetical protein